MIANPADNPEARRNYTGPSVARLSSALPENARAIIEREPRSVTQSAPALHRQWRLHFEPRLRPGVDPLTGWTTGADPLADVSLRFPDLASAVRYAERHDLAYEVRDEASARSRMPMRPHALNAAALQSWPVRHGHPPAAEPRELRT
jgi:hypothetical protein